MLFRSLEFGQSSLFVYWVHVELAYGVFSRPWHRQLTLEQVLVAYAGFTAFLFVLVRAKQALVERRNSAVTADASVS